MSSADVKIAERLVAALFKSNGYKVQISPDPYDDVCDLRIMNPSGVTETVEVKLQTPYWNYVPSPSWSGKPYNAFTVQICNQRASQWSLHQNQLSKCMNVDRLIFVQRPRDISEPIIFWEAPPLGKRMFRVSRNKKDDRVIAAFALTDMTQIAILENEKYVSRLAIS